MGCRKQTKKAFKALVEQIKAQVAAAARDIVVALDEVAIPTLTGAMNKDIAVAHVKEVAKREGAELRTSLAETVVTGVLTLVREGVGEPLEIGVDDTDEEAA